MTATNFPAVMTEIFKHEGGYVDHPKDPGGATNMGITFAVLQEWRGEPITKTDVKNLTKSEAQEIYRKRYWNVIKGDDLPAGIDLVTMDGSVNSGTGRGPKWLQAALAVAQDGKVGPNTIKAAWSANAADTINGACEARLSFLRGLKTYPTFGKGWESRVTAVRKKALEMAKAPSYAPNDIPKPPDMPIHVEPLPEPKNGTPIPLVIVGLVILAVLAFVIFGAR